MIERRLEFILRVSLIRLLRIPQALEEQVDGDGFPGTSSSPSHLCLPSFSRTCRRELTLRRVGDNNVPPVLTDPILGRSRHSGPPRRGFRPQQHLERRTIALCQSEELLLGVSSGAGGFTLGR
jgi:hypothetical protein